MFRLTVFSLDNSRITVFKQHCLIKQTSTKSHRTPFNKRIKSNIMLKPKANKFEKLREP